MEVCGTHTMAISRHGIRQAVPETLQLISGPGCPVCVTANADIDAFIEMAQLPEVIAATFGDMLKVPGTRMGLAEARSRGARVEVVYSTLDALKLAAENPGKNVVFFGVGFETTAPTVAAALMQARASGLKNFFVLSVHKVVPPALQALCAAPELAVDAFLCPGHVSAIIGPGAYQPLASEHGIPCVIAGFEPADILQSLTMLAAQLAEGRADVEVQYTRGVRPEGNPAAVELMNSVFTPSDAEWRGLGVIPGSGLKLRPEYAEFDAVTRFPVDTSYSTEPKGCICGSILTGRKIPPDCALFGRSCTPDHPVGPCMVSSEGTCAAYHQYEI
jgi:hydrogenase expression/formation protein HypD